MNSKKVVAGVMIFSVVLVSISLISAGWFSDLFSFGDDGDLEGELPTTHGKEVNLTIASAPQAPEIVFISDLGYAETAPAPADPNRTLLEDGSVQRDFEFHVWSVAGVEALPGTSVAVTDANALLTLRDVINAPNRERKSSGADPNAVTCVYDRDAVAPAGAIPAYVGQQCRVYRCSVAMQYYDDYGAAASENWEVRAYVMDNYNTEEGYKTDGTMIDNAQAIPLRVTYFNRLDSSNLVPVGGAMEFGTVAYGPQTTQPVDAGGVYPLTMRNTGNSAINPITVNGTNIPGISDNTKYILASWFSVSEASFNPCVGTALVNNVFVDSGMAQINNGPGASGDLRTCLTDVEATASIQSYSTTEPVNGKAWVINSDFVAPA